MEVRVLLIELGRPGRFPIVVDLLVSRDRVDPGRWRCLGRIIAFGATPERYHDVLREIVRMGPGNTPLEEEGPDARREMIEEITESGPIPILTDASDQLDQPVPQVWRIRFRYHWRRHLLAKRFEGLPARGGNIREQCHVHARVYAAPAKLDHRKIA